MFVTNLFTGTEWSGEVADVKDDIPGMVGLDSEPEELIAMVGSSRDGGRGLNELTRASGGGPTAGSVKDSGGTVGGSSSVLNPWRHPARA